MAREGRCGADAAFFISFNPVIRALTEDVGDQGLNFPYWKMRRDFKLGSPNLQENALATGYSTIGLSQSLLLNLFYFLINN